MLAANPGLYNGCLAAGLTWGLARGAGGTDIKLFFLACVLIAGVYGALTASRKILPLCPFAKSQFERHPEWRDVL